MYLCIFMGCEGGDPPAPFDLLQSASIPLLFSTPCFSWVFSLSGRGFIPLIPPWMRHWGRLELSVLTFNSNETTCHCYALIVDYIILCVLLLDFDFQIWKQSSAPKRSTCEEGAAVAYRDIFMMPRTKLEIHICTWTAFRLVDFSTTDSIIFIFDLDETSFSPSISTGPRAVVPYATKMAYSCVKAFGTVTAARTHNRIIASIRTSAKNRGLFLRRGIWTTG